MFSRKRASTSTDTNADDEVVVIDDFESQAESDEVSSEITVGQVVVNVSEELEAGVDNSVPDLDLVPAVQTPVVIVDDQDPEVPEQLGIAVESLKCMTKSKGGHVASLGFAKGGHFEIWGGQWPPLEWPLQSHEDTRPWDAVILKIPVLRTK